MRTVFFLFSAGARDRTCDCVSLLEVCVRSNLRFRSEIHREFLREFRRNSRRNSPRPPSACGGRVCACGGRVTCSGDVHWGRAAETRSVGRCAVRAKGPQTSAHIDRASVAGRGRAGLSPARPGPVDSQPGLLPSESPQPARPPCQPCLPPLCTSESFCLIRPFRVAPRPGPVTSRCSNPHVPLHMRLKQAVRGAVEPKPPGQPPHNSSKSSSFIAYC
jgi:hypothetical protein